MLILSTRMGTLSFSLRGLGLVLASTQRVLFLKVGSRSASLRSRTAVRGLFVDSRGALSPNALGALFAAANAAPVISRRNTAVVPASA